MYSNDTLQSMIDILSDSKENRDTSISTPYRYPEISLINTQETKGIDTSLSAEEFQSKLADIGIDCSVKNINRGPIITRYEFTLKTRIKLFKSRIDDIACALGSDNIRIQAPIPGTSLIGIEISNKEKDLISIQSILSEVKKSEYELPIGIGVDIIGVPKVIDLTTLPHLLIAGQTGSGKSVGLNGIILSILYSKTPDECKLILIDPKRVELAPYKNIPHLLKPVVTDSEEATEVISGLITEMNNRYKMLEAAGVRNITSFNSIADKKLPYIVLIIDEMADLMMTSSKQVERDIVRLAQVARAVGIHLILATQKPITKVITSLIKSNMPTRMAYRVSSQVDSRVILDSTGAENLTGRGDLLLLASSNEPSRYHSAFITDSDINNVCNFISKE